VNGLTIVEFWFEGHFESEFLKILVEPAHFPDDRLVGSHHSDEGQDVEIAESQERLEVFEWEVALLITVGVLFCSVVHVFCPDGPKEVELEDCAVGVESRPAFWAEFLDDFNFMFTVTLILAACLAAWSLIVFAGRLETREFRKW
jgi:hypothetical protein